jgi:hypothetical protein
VREELVGNRGDLNKVSRKSLGVKSTNLHISEVTIGHMLSFAQPNPTTVKSCH